MFKLFHSCPVANVKTLHLTNRLTHYKNQIFTMLHLKQTPKLKCFNYIIT